MSQPLLGAIRDVFTKDGYRVTLHAVAQAEERKIAFREIREAVLNEAADILEDYPEDRRGASCLILGITKRGRMLHIQVSHPPTVWIITVYEPDPEQWLDGRIRRR